MKHLKCLDIIQKLKCKKSCGKYLPLLWSTSIEYNPLDEDEVHEIETYEGNKNDERKGNQNQSINSEGSSETNGNSNSSSSSNSSSLQVNNDTPQGQINKQNILNGTYASSVTANESENQIQDNTTSSSSNKLKNEESRTNVESSSGKQNENFVREKTITNAKLTKSEKIMQFRKTIQNYNLQIIEELNSLFFALY